MRKSFFVWPVLLVAAFLAGYVPEYIKASRLQKALDETTQQHEGLYLRDLAGLAYMQAAEKNYGMAARTAARYFDRVRQMQANTKTDLLQSRDKVMSGLDRGDPAVLNDLEVLYGQTRAATIP